MTSGISRARTAGQAGLSLGRSSLVILLGLALLASFSETSGPDRAGGTEEASPDACTLLTPAEIQQALGVAMKPGVKQTTETSSECQWDSQDENATTGVSVSVATYDDVLFKTEASAKKAVPVSGLGEVAFKGYPHAGDLSIKKGAYMIDLGIVNFRLPPAKVDDAALTLAKLVLSRL